METFFIIRICEIFLNINVLIRTFKDFYYIYKTLSPYYIIILLFITLLLC